MFLEMTGNRDLHWQPTIYEIMSKALSRMFLRDDEIVTHHRHWHRRHGDCISAAASLLRLCVGGLSGHDER